MVAGAVTTRAAVMLVEPEDGLTVAVNGEYSVVKLTGADRVPVELTLTWNVRVWLWKMLPELGVTVIVSGLGLPTFTIKVVEAVLFPPVPVITIA